MEVHAIVRRVEGDVAVIELVEGAGGCGRCMEPGGCRSGILARPFASCREFRLPNTLGAQAGAQVVVRIGDGATLRGALLVYAVPVVGLIVGAAIGVGLWGDVQADAAGLIGAAAGLGAAASLVAWLRRRELTSSSVRPVLVRRGASE